MTMTKSGNDASTISRVARLGAVLGTLFLAIFLALTLGAAGGAFAADLQCGGVGDDGDALDCHVEVLNNLDLNDPTLTYSSTTTTSCLTLGGGAPVCQASTITLSPTLVTTISQCNGSVNGGGSTLYCTVDILNQITGNAATPAPASVNECNNSLDLAAAGGCDTYVDPATSAQIVTNTTSATVTQCNGSVNGGGSTIDCSMDQGSNVSADIPITVNQCNGSVNGGGSTLTCRVRVRTVTRASSAVTAYTTVVTTTTPVQAPLAAPVQVVVPPVVVVPVVVPPTTSGGTGGTSNFSSSTTGGSRDRLVNTGSLASTGLATNPAPLALLGLLVLMLGGAIVVVARRMRGSLVD